QAREVPVRRAGGPLRENATRGPAAGRARGGPGLPGGRRLGFPPRGGVSTLGGWPMTQGVQKVFISYRREETSPHAGRLYDAMAAHLGEHNVFMDVELAPGVDFVQRITDAVGGCHVLLVIIGPRWATLSDGGVSPRLAQPDDFVRLEVDTALRRDDVTVIPVLVGGARMPGPNDLPESLRTLSRRNALELSDMRWRYDIERLMERLHELLAGTTGMHTLPPPEAP